MMGGSPRPVGPKGVGSHGGVPKMGDPQSRDSAQNGGVPKA